MRKLCRISLRSVVAVAQRLRAQGLVSLDSACHLDAPSKKAVAELIAARVRRKELVPVAVEGAGKTQHWAMPASLAAAGMLAVFLRRGPWGYLHAGLPEAARAHIRIESLAELPDALARYLKRKT